MKRFNAGLLLWLLAVVTAPAAMAQAPDKVVVASWGGAYEAAQQATIFRPFKTITGLNVDVVTYTGTLEEIRERAKNGGWDVLDLAEDQAIAACEAGLLEPLDPKDIVTPSRRVAVEVDFLPFSFRPCSIAQLVYSTVVAFNDSAFPGEKPSRIADFFDLRRFPGRRALQRDPSAVLEWALIAEGVPLRQVYDLLSTERGLRVAFRKLDAIKDNIVWWSDPAEAATLLMEGKASMASGFNGRFFAAANGQGAPITIIWDAQIWDYDVWAIPKSSPRKAEAKEFIRFATSVDRLANLAEHISYGPIRTSALARVGRHWRSQVDMRNHLPNTPRNAIRALRRDSQWYARTHDLRQRRFEAWLAEGDKVEGE